MADIGHNMAPSCENTFSDDDIAIIGMALRTANEVDSQQALWDHLIHRRSAMGPIPQSRWSQEAHSGHSGPNMIPQEGAHFMSGDLAAFDGPFFSISPIEIESMDPQQRISLECSYQALENAGLSLFAVAGSDTSVFVGGSSHDFEMGLARDPDNIEKYASTGCNMSLLANRVSWFLDLNGPSMSIDTACSSAMSAVHLACQSLRSGESKMGLAGGANVILQVSTMIALHSLGMLSPNSVSRSFDADADGFGRGEGCGFVVLKRASDAVRDGDTIRAVIRASCANQDGHTPSIVQPSSDAQTRLIRHAYKKLDMTATRYFESHGTGTRLGDSLEASAINAAFQPTAERPLFIGAAKTNFGHLEAASGILSVIKTVLVLEHGIIPPNAFFETPNPEIMTSEAQLCFPKKATPWPNEGLRRASINSFGYGGTNVHLVLDDALHYLESVNAKALHNTEASPPTEGPKREKVDLEAPAHDESQEEFGPQLLVVSAADKDGSDRYKNRLLTARHYTALSDMDQYYIADLAYTLSEKRSHLPWRGFSLASDVQELVQGLGPSKIPIIKAEAEPHLAFIFTGQGANWPAMGKELKVFPVFAASLTQAQAHFQKLGATWSLEEELERPQDSSQLHIPEYSQPASTAVQVALVDLLNDWRVFPHVVVGHSSGEIAAAYSMGAISRSSAWSIAYYRGVAIKELSDVQKHQGGMMAVGLSKKDANEHITQLLGSDEKSNENKPSIACVNSYNSVTISGSPDSLDALHSVLEKQDVFCRRLNINVAYHSPAMRAISQAYHEMIMACLETGESSEKPPTMVSSVTGESVSCSELQKPEYWVKNMVSPVLFESAISKLHIGLKVTSKPEAQDDTSQVLPPIDLFVEVGPHSALKGPLRNIFATTCPGVDFPYVPLLTRETYGLETVLTAAGTLFQKGADIDLYQVNSDRSTSKLRQPRMLIDLPSYAFDHTHKYWAEGRMGKNYRFRQSAPHELLGHQALDWNPSAARWQNLISLDSHPWVEHHKVAGAYIYPGAGIIAMAIEATRQLNVDKNIRGFRFKDVSIVKALVISANGVVETQFNIEERPDQNDPLSNWYKFNFLHYEESAFNQLSYGTIGVELYGESSHDKPVQGDTKTPPKPSIAQNCWKKTSSEAFYDLCKAHGLQYGDSFLGLDEMSMDLQHCARATVDLDHWKRSIDSKKYQPHVIHPAALDGVLQLALAALSQMKPGFPVAIPTQFQDFWISSVILDDPSHTAEQAREAKYDVFCQADYTGLRNASVEMVATDPRTGDLVLKCRGICTTVDDRRSLSSSATQAKPLFYSLEWRPDLDLADPVDIEEYCDQNVSPKIGESGEVLDQQLALCYLTALRMLQEINGLELNEVSSKYLDFLKQCVSNIENELEPQKQAELLQERDNEEFLSSLCKAVEERTPDGPLMARIVRNMKELLLDKINVVELLFSDDIMSEYYKYVIDIDTGFYKLQKWIDAYAHKYPSCRLLEVGAGTGASSEYILEFLRGPSTQRFEEYTFTDISAGFFAKAKEALAEYGQSVQFATLDIEKDPEAQGQKLAHYDIVTATNVLHATKDIRATLRNVRSLLRPDGKLIITEIIDGSGFLPGFVVGFFPGWWLSQESERSMGPLMSESQWNTALLDAGFSGIDISFPGHRGKRHVTSTMISSVRDEAIPKSLSSTESQSTEKHSTWIIIDKQSKVQAELSLELQHQLGSTCIIKHFDDVPQAFEAEHTILLPSLEEEILQTATAQSFATLVNLLSHSRNFIWVYNSGVISDLGHSNDAIIGFARVAMTEQPHNRIKLMGFDVHRTMLDGWVKIIAKHILRVKMQTYSKRYNDYQSTYEVRDGLLHINRLQTLAKLDNYVSDRTNPQPPQPAKLGSHCLRVDIGTPGSLDTLHLIDDDTKNSPLGYSEILIGVKTCGINFKDLLLAAGKMQGYSFGSECSGIVLATGAKSTLQVGDRVSCFTNGGCMATHVRCKSTNAIRIPSWMSFVEGASWTTSFTSAYYALVEKAQINEGDRVLIHSGAGAFGQACIQIARIHGAEIFATVGNDDKARFLTDRYSIPSDHIFDSRNGRFEHDIMAATEDQGVSVVVNSLSGELLQASWRCIGAFGRFIETGKRDILAGNSLPLSMFEKNVTFFAIDAGQLAEQRSGLLASILAKVMDWLDRRMLHTLDTTTYPLSKMADGLRELSSRNTKGKIVLEMSKNDTVMVVSTGLKWRFPAKATYIIVGGLGGLGRSLAKWMSGRGATHLILLSRTGACNQEAQDLVRELERMGTKVATPACDVSIAADLENTLAKFKEFPPIKGCVQGAMVLENVLFKSMSLEAYQKVAGPRIQGTWNLHQLLPFNMDFFIMLSSLSGIIGGPGQANYASTNTYMDGLAYHRTMTGKPSVSLDIGRVLEVGYVAERKGQVSDFLMDMFPGILEKEFHAIMEYYCRPSSDPCEHQARFSQPQVMIGLDSPDMKRARGENISQWFMEQAFFRPLTQVKADSSMVKEDGEESADIGTMLAKATEIEAAVELIVQGFATKLEHTLGVATDDFDESKALKSYGIDSLSAVELRTWLRLSVDADIPVFDLVSDKSITELANQAAAISSLIPETLKGTK